MKENPRGKLTIAGIALATIVLAGIAVFTGVKIFQTRKENVSPIVPEAEPLAQAPTLTPTSIPTPTPTPLLSPTITGSLTPTPARTASTSATLTPTKKVTATPSASATLPDSGISVPTVLGISLGVFLLIAGFLLAL